MSNPVLPRLLGVLAIGSPLVLAQNGTTPASSSSPSLSVTTLNIAASSLAWDQRSQQIYLTVPGTGGSGNAIEVVNPLTGSGTKTVPLTEAPNLIAVSPNSKYVYVGLDNTSSIQRLVLPDFSPDLRIVLGSDPTYGPWYASDLQPSPPLMEQSQW